MNIRQSRETMHTRSGSSTVPGTTRALKGLQKDHFKIRLGSIETEMNSR